MRACVSKKFKVTTTDSNHNRPIAPNLLNQTFKTTAPNKVWMTDITYIPCREGRLYLGSVMVYSRGPVSRLKEHRLASEII